MDDPEAKSDPASAAENVGRTIRARTVAALATTRDVETVAGAAAAAMRIALETPDAAERWLAGEPVFRAAEQS